MTRTVGISTGAVNGHLTGTAILMARSFYRTMLADVVERIEERLAVLSISASAASKRAGLGEDAIRNMQRAVRSGDRKGVSTRTIQALAPVLHTTVGWLLDGNGDAQGSLSPMFVPLAGRVGAGARIEAIEDQRPRYVEIPVAWDDATAFEVSGDSCYPIYEDGEIIIVRGERRLVPEECLNRMCVVETEAGIGLVKRVLEGGGGAFNLESPNAPPMSNQRLVSARPVRMKVGPDGLA